MVAYYELKRTSQHIIRKVSPRAVQTKNELCLTINNSLKMMLYKQYEQNSY